MKKIKTITAACLAALMLLLGTVTAAASDYSSSGVTFTVPDDWSSHGVNWSFYKNNGYYSYAVSEYMDGLVEYSVEFQTGSDKWMKFGAKDLFTTSGSKNCKRTEYQTEDFLNELLACGKEESSEAVQPTDRAATDDSATSDEISNPKRVVTGSQDKFYLSSMLLFGTPELITISDKQFIYQHIYDRDIYAHVHNGVLYQFRDDNAGKGTMEKILSSVSFSKEDVVIPTTARSSSSRKKNSSSSNSSIPYLLIFCVISAALGLISRSVKINKYDGKKKVNSIRLIEPTESSGDDTDEDEADENDDES